MARRDVSTMRTLDVMRTALTDWQGLFSQETGPARQALSALLTGRLIFTPDEREGKRLYRFSGEGTITPVLAGVVGACAEGVVSPTGHARRWHRRWRSPSTGWRWRREPAPRGDGEHTGEYRLVSPTGLDAFTREFHGVIAAPARPRFPARGGTPIDPLDRAPP
jgi:hypothetical protein